MLAGHLRTSVHEALGRLLLGLPAKPGRGRARPKGGASRVSTGSAAFSHPVPSRDQSGVARCLGAMDVPRPLPGPSEVLTSWMSEKGFLLVLTLVHLSVMLFGIGRQNLWVDEVTSLEVARSSFTEMARFFRMVPEQHPLYYLLLRGWLSLGTSEAALRLLSVLFGVTSLWTLYFLTRSLFDETLAKLAALLLCFSPFYLFYAQEARMYTLLGFLALVTSYAFVGLVRFASTPWAALYVASGILGVYTHIFFFFLLAAHSCFLILRDRRLGADFLRVAACQGVVGVTYVPWAVLLLFHMPKGHFWKGTQHIIFGVPYTFFRFSLGYSELLANYQWKERIGQLLLDNSVLLFLSSIAFGGLVISGVAYLKRAGQHGLFVLTCLLAPMAIALLISMKVILMGERYFVVSFPFYVIVLAAGMRSLWAGDRARRTVAVVITVLYVSIIGRCFYNYFGNPEFGKEQWREVAAYVSDHRQDGDLILFHGSYVKEAFRYYYRLDHEFRTSHDVRSSDLSGRQRVWLVVALANERDHYWRSFESEYQTAMRRVFPRESGIGLFLLVRKESS